MSSLSEMSSGSYFKAAFLSREGRLPNHRDGWILTGGGCESKAVKIPTSMVGEIKTHSWTDPSVPRSLSPGKRQESTRSKNDLLES